MVRTSPTELRGQFNRTRRGVKSVRYKRRLRADGILTWSSPEFGDVR